VSDRLSAFHFRSLRAFERSRLREPIPELSLTLLEQEELVLWSARQMVPALRQRDRVDGGADEGLAEGERPR
jgi:hypothetical protein